MTVIPSDLDDLLDTEFPTESPYKNTAVIVFPVEFDGFQSPIEDAHLTVAYLPDLALDTPAALSVERVRNAMSPAGGSHWRIERVTGAGAFGKDKNIPVLLIDSAFVKETQYTLTKGFRTASIDYDTTYEYNPHVTVNLETALNRPKYIILRPLEIWWNGTEKIKVFS